MKWLITGGTGLLGTALVAEGRKRGVDIFSAARNRAPVTLDIRDDVAISRLIDDIRPDVVINAAALTSLDDCQRFPDLAYRINGRAAGALAVAAAEAGSYFVQISTDHFFTGDGNARHGEDAPVTLVNEYARSKYVGEQLALTNRDALVVRCNFTGFGGQMDTPTFAEWAVDAITGKQPLSLFDDYYTSTIDAPALAVALADIVAHKPRGILNLAARDVASKYDFIVALGRSLGDSDFAPTHGCVKDLATPRAESCGLDVAEAEALLGRRLPTLAEVTGALAAQYGEQGCAIRHQLHNRRA